MKSKGLGDTIEKFTKATGIKKLVDTIPGGCNCDHRKDWFNKHNCFKDKICRNNCLDVCIDYNNKFQFFN